MASAGKGNVICDWAELLPELLTLIAKRMHSYEDFAAFGGVCRSWRSVAVKENFNSSASSSRVQIPWLMLAEKQRGDSEIRGFASLRKGGMVHKVDLPEARGRRCISSMDWLITTDKQGNTELLHPVSRNRIPLPHPHKYYYDDHDLTISDKFLIRRAVLSASPSLTDDYVLMVTLHCECHAAFWRPGNKIWTFIEEARLTTCLDVIYYKDQFYAIQRGICTGILTLCDPNSGAAQTVGHVCCDATDRQDGNSTYLVESPSGDLLIVTRIRYIYDGYHDNYSTYWFRIYKVDSADMNKWQQIYDLQGASIFVGHSAATAVPANAAAGIKPNCIYFTDDYAVGYSITNTLIGGKDMGIYSLESRKTEYLTNIITPLNNCCPPIWVYLTF